MTRASYASVVWWQWYPVPTRLSSARLAIKRLNRHDRGAGLWARLDRDVVDTPRVPLYCV